MEKKRKIFPCKNCICLAVCKSRYYEGTLSSLMNKCSLILNCNLALGGFWEELEDTYRRKE